MTTAKELLDAARASADNEDAWSMFVERLYNKPSELLDVLEDYEAAVEALEVMVVDAISTDGYDRPAHCFMCDSGVDIHHTTHRPDCPWIPARAALARLREQVPA